MKTSSYSSSDTPGAADGLPYVRLDDVSLRFILYGGKAARPGETSLLKRLAGPFRRMRAAEQFWALKGISLRIDHGERVGIIGPNGAGKTTLLKTIAGIYLPSRGRIEVAGNIAPLINLGAGFSRELTARDNIILYGSLLGYSRRQMASKVERILEFAGIRKFEHMPTKYYSRGMLMRLGFSVATDILPEILLVDEVFGGGDAEFRQRARERMTCLMDAAKILIMVTHNMKLVRTLNERAIWLKEGRVVMDAAPKAVCPAYLRSQGAEEDEEGDEGGDDDEGFVDDAADLGD